MLRGVGRERAVLLLLGAIALAGGVLGLAAPPPTGGHDGVLIQAVDLARIGTTVVFVAVLLLGPGLAWRLQRPERHLELGFVPLPGLALLVGTGCLAWGLAYAVSPRVICACILLPVTIAVLAVVLRGSGPVLDSAERWALAVVAIMLGVAVARSLWSLGPDGELIAGNVSRTLEVGDRPDSRIPFRVVQLVAHGDGPFSTVAQPYFAPYNFSARGPIPGVASAPIVLIASGRPPRSLQDAPWSPFDAQGFMAYRLAMMAFAATAFLALWTLTRRLGGERAARLALLLACTTPFLVHEVWFTWPKLFAASFVLLAAIALIDGRAITAGLLVGVGYLVHPLALLSVPALGLLALWPFSGARLRRPHLRDAALMATGALVCLIGWRLANGSHFTQGDFLDYLTRGGRTKALTDALLQNLYGVEPDPVTLTEWLSHRFESITNTVVPLRLVLFSADDPAINVVDPRCTPLCAGDSPPVIHFFFQYWTAVPFGLAIVLLPLLLVSLWRAARLWPWPFAVAVVVPFATFAIYWGDTSTGLLREGLHPWVLALIVVVALQQRQAGMTWLRAPPLRAVLSLRSAELFLVAVLPTIATQNRLYGEDFLFTDIVALMATILLCAALGALVWREGKASEQSNCATSAHPSETAS